VKQSLSVNVVANYLGVAWATLVQLLLVPINVKLLGVEQYGLIGFWVTLQSVLQVLDLGLSPAINRELARHSALGGRTHESGDLVRTLESVYWAVAAVLGVAVVVAAPFLASRWITVKAMRPEDVRTAIAVMGLTIALQWPISVYGGGLLGLERQVLLVAVNSIVNLVFAVGTVLILVFVWRTVHAFFAWRAAISFIHVIVLRYLLWRSLRPDGAGARPRFRLGALSGIWRFSIGMTGIAVTGVILMQTDKVILSKMLSLDFFGYYMLAASGAAVLGQLAGPIFTAIFPRFSHLVAARDVQGQKAYFHSCAQLTTVAVCPAAITLALFPHDILAIWTRNEAVAVSSAPALALLCVGTLLNSLMVLPYALQLANGWTRLGTYINVGLVCLAVPYTILATRHYGMVGAASTWVVLNAIYLVVGAPLTFRRLLPGEGWGWLRRDVLIPAAWAIALPFAVWLAIPQPGTKTLMTAKIALAAALSYVGAVLSSQDVKRQLAAFGGAVQARWQSRRGAQV